MQGPERRTEWPVPSGETADVTVAVMMNEDRLDYLRPNRYFRFYLFREKQTDITCWLPEGFLA